MAARNGKTYIEGLRDGRESAGCTPVEPRDVTRGKSLRPVIDATAKLYDLQ